MRTESINTQEEEACKIIDEALQDVTTTTKLQEFNEDPVLDQTLHPTIMHKPVEDIMRQAEKDPSWIASLKLREKEHQPNVSMMLP